MNIATVPASFPALHEAPALPIGTERDCPRCGTRTAWTGYDFEHCSEGHVGQLSCPIFAALAVVR